MATISASYSFADGDLVTITVDVENDYPDAMAEAAKTCMTALREAMVLGIVTQPGEGEDEE